ncbi:hypothetical protein OHA21_05325 [Actinoplanes sp. NBC_00393]|uniref:hypothetical protein n=1 Tax=Actinoplanes sp. NBC_00393 TaxID=2975953 RepID=UPI002E1A2A12
MVFLDGLEKAQATAAMPLVTAALENAADIFDAERRAWSRARQQVITAHEALQERELLKMSSLAAALIRALTGRGIEATTAALAAESGVTVFRTAFAAWIADGEDRSFGEIQHQMLDKLRETVR